MGACIEDAEVVVVDAGVDPDLGDVEPPAPEEGVRFVRISTADSRSWVAWAEI